MTKIGTGFIAVDADLGPFWRKVDREMAGLDARGKRIGRSLGSSIGDGLNTRGIDAVRSSLSGLDRDSRKASKGLAGLVATAGGGGSFRRTARDLDDFGGSVGHATASIGGFRIAIAALVPTVVAFSGASAAAASSLAPLIGLAAAGANALGSAAQGFGVLKLATAGIGDALQEQTDKHTQAATAAVSSAGQQRSAARSIQSAQDGVRSALDGVQSAADGVRDAIEGVTDAERDVGTAQKDAKAAQKGLTVARREAGRALVDMHAALVNAVSAESHAVFALSDAFKALTDLQTGPTQDALADGARSVTEAVHGQQQAVLSLRRAQESLDQIMGRSVASEERKAAAAAALARAQSNLARVEADANATYDERTHALQLVAEATKVVNDANAAATVSELDKAQALHDVTSAQDALAASQVSAAQAQKALGALQTGPADEDKRRALLDISDAEQALIEARRERLRLEKDSAAADKAGVEGSAQVVAAKDAIAQADARVKDAERAVRDAHRDVADAQKDLRDAHRGVVRASEALSDAQLDANEAMVKGGLAAANLNEKFDKLPPAAQAFVRQLQAMKPQFDALRATAASGFFPGATAGLQAAAKNFGPLQRVVAATARVLGDLSRRAGELVGSAGFGRDIETIGTRNAKVLDTLGSALLHVISALRHVMVAAGPLTQWLADVADKWALNAAESAKAGRESGKMADFFERTRAITERLGSILGHLTSGLIGVGRAGSKTGDDIWASIDRAAARFDAWANSAKGQTELHDFFRRSTELAGAIVPVLGNVAKAVALLALRLLPLTTLLQILGPYADEATIAFVGYKAAVLAASIVTKAATAATWLWTTAQTVAALRANAWTIAVVRSTVALAAGAVATRAAAAATWLATTASGAAATAFWALNAAIYANPIGAAVVAIVALSAALVVAYNKVGWFHEAVDAVFDFLSNHWPLVFGIVTGPVGLAVATVIEAWGLLKTATEAAWGAISGSLNRSWSTILFAANVAWNAIKLAILGPPRAARDLLVEVVAGIANRLTTGWENGKTITRLAWEAIKNFVLTPIRLARDTIPEVLTGIANRISMGWSNVKSLTSSAWEIVRDFILTPIRNARDLLPDVMTGIFNRVKSGWDAVLKGIRDFAGNAKDAITGAFKGAANLVIGFINAIINAINAIPGVPNIKEIDKLAEGGVHQAGGVAGAVKPRAFAHGGAFARTGGVVGSPITLMGEEAPRHPEFVIPTNPAYRGRAQMLLGQAAGAIGLAEGGVVSAFRSAIDRTNANPKPSLALWEAGIVESGLRNLPYGDRDSTGALQVRASTGGPMGINPMDPFAVAMGFLTRGYWGKGSAKQLAARNPSASAGWVAQQTQGSAFPDRYDAVRGQALPYLRGAGVGATATGSVGTTGTGVGGILGDLLSQGASLILDKLPGVGDLPDWLKGTGKYVLDEVGEWIKEKVKGIVADTGGTPIGGGTMTGGRLQLPATFRPTHQTSGLAGYPAIDIFGKPGTGVLSPVDGNVRRFSGGPSSYTGPGGPFGYSMYLAGGGRDYFLTHFGSRAVRVGENVKYGDLIGTIGDYPGGVPDHIHEGVRGLAKGGVFDKMGGIFPPYQGEFHTGGIVGGPIGQPAMITALGGEAVVPDGDRLLGALRENTDELRALRRAGVSGVMASIADYTMERGGQESHRRRMTAGNPSVTALLGG